MNAAIDDLARKVVIVPGGTGNVGSNLVRALLNHGAIVAVPSRSKEKIGDLRSFLSLQISEKDLSRLVPFVGDFADEAGAETLARAIPAAVGDPFAVVTSLGQIVPAPSILAAPAADLRRALESYTIAHFMAARTLLPLLRAAGGKYLFINGPLAFDPWKNSGAGLVSVATAGQHMLFRSIAQELEGSATTVMELVIYTFVRGRQTQPGSRLPVEAVAEFAVRLLQEQSSGQHGQSLHLRSPELVAQLAG